MAWKIANLTAKVGSTWRVANLTATVAPPPQSWRVAGLKVAITAKWKVAKLSVATTSVVTPVLAPIAPQSAPPLYVVTITAKSTNGITPDYYTFTCPGLTFTVSGNVATFVAPALLSESATAYSITVTATKGSSTSAPVTAVVTVSPTQFEAMDNGVVVPVGNWYGI